MKILPRRLQGLGKDAPAVESRLDEFIERANNELVDVSDFSPEKQAEREQAAKREADEREHKHEEREHALEKQVAELQQRITKIQARKRPSQGWGKLVIGFVLGCGSMFAVSALMPPHERVVEKQATAVTPAPAPPQQPPPAPTLPIAVTPIEPGPAAQPQATPPAPPPTAPPVAPAVAEKPPTEKPVADKPTKKHHSAPPKQPDAPKQSDAPKQPATQPAGTGSGSEGLYNPF